MNDISSQQIADKAQNPSVDLTVYRQQYTYYAKRLLSDLGLGDLPEPERGQLLVAIEAYVQQVLTNTLLENLNDQSLNEAEKIIDRGGTQEEVIIYLLTNIPEIEMKMADALARAYARMLEESRALAQAVTESFAQNTTQTPEEAVDSPASVPSGIDENPRPTSSTDTDGNAAEIPERLTG